MQLAPLGPFSVRRNPWDESAVGEIHACILKNHKLNRHLEQAVRRHTKIETDPDVMQLSAHRLSNVIEAVKAYLVSWTPHEALLDKEKETLKEGWDTAKKIESEAKRLRRDPDWKTWVALHERPETVWKRAEAKVPKAVHEANKASSLFQQEQYDVSVRAIYTSALIAISVLEDYGYEKLDLEVSRQALRAYDLLRQME